MSSPIRSKLTPSSAWSPASWYRTHGAGSLPRKSSMPRMIQQLSWATNCACISAARVDLPAVEVPFNTITSPATTSPAIGIGRGSAVCHVFEQGPGGGDLVRVGEELERGEVGGPGLGERGQPGAHLIVAADDRHVGRSARALGVHHAPVRREVVVAVEHAGDHRAHLV